ncbi:MAG: response regulator [Magnetococcales bacterium]|nr:response regulator [Magnetococcales bacterium]NGZ29254.1 response regulator [Magnetococcales bacterium]
MKTIFVVDDSATMLMSLEGVLTRAGMGVAKATSGEDAVAQLKAGLAVDLVITDFNMPGMNGIDLIKEIRKMPAYRFKPVLMLTTESQVEKQKEAKAAGATGWMVKPVDPDKLIAVIKQVVPGA